MYKYCFSKKEFLNRFFYCNVEFKKVALKSLLASVFIKKNQKFFFQKKFLFFGKKMSITFYRNRCLITN